MTWTAVNPVTIGNATKKSVYDKLWDNGQYLLIEHNTDGTHKAAALASIQATTGLSLTNLLPNTQRKARSGSTTVVVRALPDATSTRSGTTVSSDLHLLTAGKCVAAADGTFLKVITAAANSFTVDRAAGTDGQWNEVAPGYVAADTLAPDGTTKTSTLDLLTTYGDTTHTKQYYGDKLTKGADTAEYHNLLSITGADLQQYLGRNVALGMAGYSVTKADNLKIQIYDGVGTTESAFWAADTLSWKEITRTVNAAATELTFRVLLDGATGDVSYGSMTMAVLGTSIGEYNYQPKTNEYVPFKSQRMLTAYNNASSLDTATVSLEAQSSGAVGSGGKGVWVYTSHKNTTAGVFMQVDDGAAGGPMVNNVVQVSGIASTINGFVGCDANGDMRVYMSATSSTAIYVGIQGIQN